MTILLFDDFEMDTQSRSLKRRDREVRIGSRAFDILTALTSKQGQILSKAELMEAAWPDTHVEESSLRVNIVALRKVLDGVNPGSMIENVAGRGYTFTPPVTKLDGHENLGSASRMHQPDVLPNACARLVGREDLIARWSDNIGAGITTIVGQGGIGKTSMAIQIARCVQNAYERVQFVDVADRANDSPCPLALALKARTLTSGMLSQAIESFSGESVLLIIDGCDWSIDRVALIAESIADRNSDAAILATSREPLGIIGENVLYLPGLAVPEAEQEIDDLAAFSGIQLFAERVSMVAEEFAIDGPGNIKLAADVVRMTDGNPLAIELAASRVADLGLEYLVASLDRPLRTLRRGNRTAHPRQQTLRASIDWSYDLLDSKMQALLGLLSSFGGEFTRELARERYGCYFGPSDFEEAFDGLVVKSLVDSQQRGGSYSLPRLIREYALEKQRMSAVGYPAEKMEHVAAESAYRPPYPARNIAPQSNLLALQLVGQAA
ncbi:winged helix-turn-helix domain-containing protein [Rhizobium cauense]|uniref:ATP-binding protein n=1 Tax=Rhizobium cauense TaxID=1166683 RepID=UPI001C6EFA01|nr:winged helix-turn-helix domain-containing protein [Rhizobium cauense]MBW9116899.1 winged helix-turn-helix domain-containing protein [Rhizobium cauense]